MLKVSVSFIVTLYNRSLWKGHI